MNQKDLLEEIGQIRQIMERSSKFVSISGLSGVLIGLYALIGACVAYIKVYGFKSEFGYRDHYVSDPGITLYLFFVALAVLIASLVTAVFMGKRKAKRLSQSVWSATSKSLFFAVGLPLMSGGILALVFISKGYYDLIAGTLLIFYGLALAAGSTYTFKEVRWLGLFEIVLGLIAVFLPGYGIVFWALGFGVLHIIYGFIVYKKYE